MRTISHNFIGWLANGKFVPKQVFDKAELKQRLTESEYYVTQQGGYNDPYKGIYNQHSEEGYYNCKVCDKHLFQSEKKYYKYYPYVTFTHRYKRNIIFYIKCTTERETTTEYFPNYVVICKCGNCGAYLGDVARDDINTSGERFNINSDALKFVPYFIEVT